MIRLYLWFRRVRFWLHADRGCGGHPAFPAPCFSGALFFRNSGVKAGRDG
jgi:hypothetical protein